MKDVINVFIAGALNIWVSRCCYAYHILEWAVCVYVARINRYKYLWKCNRHVKTYRISVMMM